MSSLHFEIILKREKGNTKVRKMSKTHVNKTVKIKNLLIFIAILTEVMYSLMHSTCSD